ncbi:MAG: O-antigen ligase family protein, partial [Verrucomicrobia bacterium]|nr:O-antigen ligase family protein [Verrucomicrobiota bacterium]
MEQHGSNSSAANGASRQKIIASVFVALTVVLPLLSYPLAILPPGWAINRFDFRFPWGELAAVALLAALLREPRAPLRLPLQAEPPVLALLALVFAQTLSALINDTEGRLAWMMRSVCHLMLTLAAAHFLRASDLKRIAAAWTFAAVAQVLVVLLQTVFGIEQVGTIGNRNFVAGYLALSLPIGVAWLVARARQQAAFSAGWLMAWLWVFNYAAVLLVAIALTRSRGAALALALAAGAWGLTRLRPRARWLVGGIAVIVVAIAAFSPALIQSAKTQWRLDVRPAIWLGTVRAIAEAPLFGHGPGSFVRAYPAHRPPEYFDRPKAAPVTDHAHNEFLETAAETGLVGLAAFLGVIMVGARAARVAIRRAEDPTLRALAEGASLGFITLLVHNLFDIN